MPFTVRIMLVSPEIDECYCAEILFIIVFIVSEGRVFLQTTGMY